MITFRPAGERGRTKLFWLDSRHTFSFGDYYDPAHEGFRVLRVLNDDRVQPGAGFPTHPHRDMEILSFVLEGALQHKDSMGNGSVIRPGDVQRMSAGTGVLHSEYNPSRTEPVHFLQVWIFPERKGLTPGYEQRAFPLDEIQGRLRRVASRNGTEGAVTIHQDAEVWAGFLVDGDRVQYGLRPDRHAWVHVATGSVTLNGSPMDEGDGAAASDESTLTLEGRSPAEILVFDLP